MTAINTQLSDLAIRIFTERAAANFSRVPNEGDALACFKSAEVFLSVKAKIENGEIRATPLAGPQLADCHAPNLPRNSPFNIVSQQFGDLAKVAKLHKWLVANPAKEETADEVLARLNREFKELNWDIAAMNTARSIFPSFVAA